MRPADAYRLKYRSAAAECQTIEASKDESNTAWGPEPYRADAPRMGCAAAVDGRLYVFAGHSCYIYTPGSHPRALALAEEARALFGHEAPAPTTPTFLRRVPKCDVRRIRATPGNDDTGPIMGLFRAVEVRGTRGRIVGDAGVRSAQGHDNEGRAGPFDILVTDDVAGDEREWQKTWWRSVFDGSMMEYTGCTCAVVGREILIFGGPNDLHAESDDLARHLHNLMLMDNDERPEMMEYVTQRFFNEAADTIFDTTEFPALPDTRRFPTIVTPKRGFRRFDERLAAQSEGAAAAVVYV